MWSKNPRVVVKLCYEFFSVFLIITLASRQSSVSRRYCHKSLIVSALFLSRASCHVWHCVSTDVTWHCHAPLLVTIIPLSLLCKSVLCALRLITTHWEFPAALLSTLRCARLSTARLLRSLRSRQCVSVSHPSRALLSFRVPGRKTPGYQKCGCGFFPSFLPPDIGHWIQTAEKPKSRLERKLSLVRTRSLPAMTSQLWCKHSIQPEQILWSTGLWS